MADPVFSGAVVQRGKMVLCSEQSYGVGDTFAWREDEGFSFDVGFDFTSTRPRLLWQSPWIQLAGVLGQERTRNLWLLGTFPSTTVLEIAYDFDSPVELKDNFGTNEVGQIVQFELPRQDCYAVQFLLRGHTRLVAARIEAELEKGTYRKTATRA
jgi:hypothetical protein